MTSKVWSAVKVPLTAKKVEGANSYEKIIENENAIRGIPPKDAPLYSIKTAKNEWHIAFNYKFMGRWVMISTSGKYIERSEVVFSRNVEDL